MNNNNNKSILYRPISVLVFSDTGKGPLSLYNSKHRYDSQHSTVNSKLAFYKVASFHPHYLTCILQIYHYPKHQVMVYADDITSTRTSAAKKYIQPYLFLHGQNNNLTLNPDIQLALFHSRTCGIYNLKINNTALPMATHLKVLCLTLDSHTVHTFTRLYKS